MLLVLNLQVLLLLLLLLLLLMLLLPQRRLLLCKLILLQLLLLLLLLLLPSQCKLKRRGDSDARCPLATELQTLASSVW